jgi:FkbM family methyltransferase
MPPPWSTPDTLLALLRDAGRWRDRWWIVAYFAARRSPAPLAGGVARLRRAEGILQLAGLPRPLHVTGDSGGLATYYEIVTREIYGQRPGFAPATGHVVVDVGANIGVFSAVAAARLGPQGRLVSIEPHPHAYALLLRNAGGYETRSHLIEGACGERPDRLELRYVPGRLSVSSFEPRDDRTEAVTVDVRPLDDILDELDVDEIDLIKLDVESHELSVIAGARRAVGRARRVVVETDDEHAGDVACALRSAGMEQVHEVTGMWGIPEARIAYFERPAV